MEVYHKNNSAAKGAPSPLEQAEQEAAGIDLDSIQLDLSEEGGSGKKG